MPESYYQPSSYNPLQPNAASKLIAYKLLLVTGLPKFGVSNLGCFVS